MSQLVYFSSSSENTQRFIERLGLPAVRIPLNERERIQVDEPYILDRALLRRRRYGWRGATTGNSLFKRRAQPGVASRRYCFG
ncbi:class Ib ribonucleoside-diphosphate reductase assembly flavoprotein NrdI [Escherichia coli]